MNPSDVADGYNQLAEIWDSDEFDRENGIAQHRRALAFCNLDAEQSANALDVGCGCSGRIIDLLLEHGLQVEGLDASPRMVELAQRRHANLTFHLADICQWTSTRKYHFISAWDSIWHVPLDQHEGVLRKLFGLLNAGGVCIFTMGGLEHASEKTDQAMGPHMYYSTLGVARVLQVIEEAGCVCRHLEYDQYPELHLYLIVQKV